MLPYPGLNTPFSPFSSGFLRTPISSTPSTTSADPLPPRGLEQGRGVLNALTLPDDIARTWADAQATGHARNWSIDECMTLSRQSGRTAAALAEARYDYVRTLAGTSASPPRTRHPWRACEARAGASSGGSGADSFADLPETAAGTVPPADRCPYRLWFDDRPRTRFALSVRLLPEHCLMRVAVPDGSAPGPLVRRTDFQWGPLAQGAATAACSPLRRYAVSPRPPAMAGVIHAGACAWRGAADAWRPEPAGTNGKGEASGAGGDAEGGRCANGDAGAGGPLRFAELLATVNDATPLRIADDETYLAIRDREGRFWLRVVPADARVAQVADPRAERCLPALFVQPAQPGNAPWRQVGADLPDVRCAAHAVPDAGVAMADDASAAPGSLMGQGFDTIATELGGPGRWDPRAGGAFAERMLLEALGDIAHPPTARAVLAPLLDAWPASLRDRASDVIRYVLKDVWRVAVDFNRADGRTLHLIDNLAGGGDFVVWRGEAFITPAIVELSPQAFAHRLVDWFVASSGGRTERFARLPERNATLTRAGRFSAYDPTLMQEMLGWPGAARSLASLATFHPGAPDTARVRAMIATPRRADLLSQDHTDNLALALTDRGTVMAIVDALRAARVAACAPVAGAARAVACANATYSVP